MKTNPFITQIRDVEKRLKELKAEQRDPAKQPPEGETMYAIATDKVEATILYARVAEYRGKVHHQKWTREDQRKFLDKHNVAAPEPKQQTASAAA